MVKRKLRMLKVVGSVALSRQQNLWQNFGKTAFGQYAAGSKFFCRGLFRASQTGEVKYHAVYPLELLFVLST